MASVVAFVVTVELIALRGKLTDVARRECQRSAWENCNMLFSQTERRHSCLATSVILPRNAINSTVTTNATTEAINAQPESAVIW